MTPVIDGQYYDRATGELRNSNNHEVHMAPPAVGIVIRNVHENALECTFRAARRSPMDALLCHILRVVTKHKLTLDSVVAKTYTICVVLADELTVGGFYKIAQEMVSGE
ncbi:hypothetical protein QBC47DRAFT_430829 [Echria macrotheca]|uniref:Uncharacterized protein n=1 Tax=Echria macrotheca TaxID=438768 RepID=A0AAJ0FA35_9PEZI|nr:hypothetical protein QBC47DRAFT_430829 [Echria macrotheca]